MIKNTQKSAVLFAALIMLGACAVSPKIPESKFSETEFLQAVQGKIVNIEGVDVYKFSSDGRSIDEIPATGIPMTLSKMNSPMEAVYVLQDPGEATPDAFATMKLNDDIRSGSFVLEAADGTIIQQGQATLK